MSTLCEPTFSHICPVAALAGLSLLKEPGVLGIHPELNLSQRAAEHLHKLHKLWDSS